MEVDDPYNIDVHPCIDGLETVALVPDSRWLPVRDFELLKRSIFYYGAVYAGIHWDVSGNSFNSDDNTYHYSGAGAANHAILVCGWDDDMVTAGGTGAWIVKNSWDTTWADKGFFYISYQDSKFAADEMAYFPVRWENSEVDTVFTYDKLGFTGTIPAPNTSKVFELAKFDALSSHLLTHVGVAVPDPETALDFHVYDDFDGEELSNLLGSRENLYIEIPGIYTFELPVTVEGDFYVQVTREVGTEETNYPVEAEDPGFSAPVFDPDVNWLKREETGSWRPTSFEDPGVGYNLTIRAYARKTDAPLALFMTDKKEACLNSDVTFSYLENNPATSFEWDFGADATPATADTEGPHQVSYSTEGTKTISLKVSGASGADSVIRYDYIDVVPSISVNILKKEMLFQQGKTVEISAYGGDSYSWSPTSIVDVDTGQTVQATPAYAGTHTLIVTGTQGECISSDTIKLSTTNKPPNDDMCDAILIKPGGWIGAYSNEYATAQDGEPAPDDTDCYAPMQWCYEDGVSVNNSLWFYFIGPEEGLASIRTDGMDNQLAVYQTDTCTNIVKDSLFAANDDYSESPEVLAATIDAFTVTPGRKYFLQIDGSFGGAKGTFNLSFYAYPTSTNEFDNNKTIEASLRIYPNPSRDVFNIKLDDAISSDVEVLLYNLNGQLIMKKSFRDVPGELFTRLDVSRQASGIYHLRVIDGERIIDRKLVKE